MKQYSRGRPSRPDRTRQHQEPNDQVLVGHDHGVSLAHPIRDTACSVRRSIDTRGVATEQHTHHPLQGAKKTYTSGS